MENTLFYKITALGLSFYVHYDPQIGKWQHIIV